MSDGIQKLRQSKLFWLFMVVAIILIYNYVGFQILFIVKKILKSLIPDVPKNIENQKRTIWITNLFLFGIHATMTFLRQSRS